MAEKEKTDKSDKQEETTNNQSKDGGRTPMKVNYAIIGGVVGAGVGLLSHPETGKKVASGLGKSEVMRIAGNELRRTAQEFITEQAMVTLRQTAAGYMNKYENGILPFNKKKEEAEDQQEETSSGQQNDDIEEIKEENKNLNERLDRIEEMLSSLVESKK
jgi:gas vesicle protein